MRFGVEQNWCKFGQTADAFKTRIGGAGQRLNLYVQPRGWYFAWIIHFTQRFLFQPCPVLEAHDVFKEVPANAKANRDRKGANKARAL